MKLIIFTIPFFFFACITNTENPKPPFLGLWEGALYIPDNEGNAKKVLIEMTFLENGTYFFTGSVDGKLTKMESGRWNLSKEKYYSNSEKCLESSPAQEILHSVPCSDYQALLIPIESLTPSNWALSFKNGNEFFTVNMKKIK